LLLMISARERTPTDQCGEVGQKHRIMAEKPEKTRMRTDV
jgi:hypothetical protein